jgi:hypothetical protein
MNGNKCHEKFVANILSNSQEKIDFEKAKQEWIDTGIFKESGTFAFYCQCTKPMKTAYIIRNRRTKKLLDVGCDCRLKMFPYIGKKKFKKSDPNGEQYLPNPEKEHVDQDELNEATWEELTYKNAITVLSRLQSEYNVDKNNLIKIRDLCEMIKGWATDFDAFIPLYKEICERLKHLEDEYERIKRIDEELERRRKKEMEEYIERQRQAIERQRQAAERQRQIAREQLREQELKNMTFSLAFNKNYDRWMRDGIWKRVKMMDIDTIIQIKRWLGMHTCYVTVKNDNGNPVIHFKEQAPPNNTRYAWNLETLQPHNSSPIKRSFVSCVNF